MNLSLVFTRIFFAVLSIFFTTNYMVSQPYASFGIKLSFGIILGCLFFLLLIGFDLIFRKFNLRSFNIAFVGLFTGYLMGQALLMIFDTMIQIAPHTITISETAKEISKTAFFLSGTYLGMILALKSSDELYISIPFIRLSETNTRKKDIVLDSSLVADVRLVDLCSCGIFNHQLVLPRFILKDLYHLLESNDEVLHSKAKRALEVIKKLQSMPGLHLRIHETDFVEITDIHQKVLRLARLIDANIMTADVTRLPTALAEGIELINLHSLSNAMKPLMQSGESIRIKVQRYGKEPKQGVGYLEDGTMVVINNGGDFLGELIDTKVISVKQTSAGRIIFTNAVTDNLENDLYDERFFTTQLAQTHDA
jgi:uncharacterized protein YacL